LLRESRRSTDRPEQRTRCEFRHTRFSGRWEDAIDGQLITESLLLAVISGVLGLLFSLLLTGASQIHVLIPSTPKGIRLLQFQSRAASRRDSRRVDCGRLLAGVTPHSNPFQPTLPRILRQGSAIAVGLG